MNSVQDTVASSSLENLVEALVNVSNQLTVLAKDLVNQRMMHREKSDLTPSAFRFDNTDVEISNNLLIEDIQLIRRSRLALPDPRLIRRIIHQRHLRTKFFDNNLFGEPAWDILLDLTAARAENVRVSVTSLCIASGVPPTTALRWIGQMTDAGMLNRFEDDTDRRRTFIALSDSAADTMARFFATLNNSHLYF